MALLILGAVLAVGGTASAHALLQSSDPAAGDTLTASPSAVTITFGETPDPKLSTIKVLDSAGNPVQTGATEAVDGHSDELTVSLPTLQPGVYTVSWRTVSTVDGHLATGSYAFGVGVSPPAAGSGSSGEVGGSSELTALAVAARWLLYAGLIVLLGACVMAVRGLGGVSGESDDARPLRTVMLIASTAAALGSVLVLYDQLSTAGVSLGDISGTSFASAVVLRLSPLVPGAIGLIWFLRRPGSKRAVVLLAASAAAAMLADVALSHAAAGDQPILNGTIQWLHIVGAGAWAGGLVSLLVWLRHRPPTESAASVARRFSRVATVAIALVAVTGVLRAIVEVGTIDALFSTTFGLIVIAKAVLLTALAGLGAINHFVSIPRAAAGIPLLRRVGVGETAAFVVVVLLTSVMVNLAPPFESAATAAPTAIVVSGSDFGTSVRVSLAVSPGTAGFDTFTADVRDYDTGAPAEPSAVALRFVLPERPDVGGSRLDLERQDDGTFAATGSNLSIDGTWTVTAVISSASSGVEVPLQVTTRIVRQPVDVNVQAGLPTIYIVHLDSGGTVQMYLDPGSSGANELHATFFDVSGNETPVTSATMSIGLDGQPAQQLTPRILEPGHFVADTTLDQGNYLATVIGAAPSGSGSLVARADMDVTR